MNSTTEPRFARVAAMIGDPTRARMLASLLDGSMMTAGEIARAADVTPQTASAHLAKLAGSGLVAVREQGRHRLLPAG
jgi:DNA-binding transcriptional ArsR family regulator